MFFETRKLLIGFRIKLIFDSALSLEPTYVYVDVMKTPTVADLIKDIRERFKITHDIFIAFDNCQLLLSENVCVLAEIDEARVGMVVAVSSSSAKSSETNTQPLTETNLHVIHNTPIVKPVKTKTYPCLFDSVAATIKQLQEERKVSDQPADEERVNSAVFVESYERSERRKNNVDGDSTFENDTNKMFDNGSANIDEVAFDDVNDLVLEKQKRKRKRKHTKKTKAEISVADEPKKKNINCYVPINVERKHIFFNHEDEQDTVAEQSVDTTGTEMKSSYETFSFRNLPPASDENRNKESRVNEKAELFPEPPSVNNKKCETSNRVKTVSSDLGSPSIKYQECYRSRTNSASSQISLPNLPFQRGDSEKTKSADKIEKELSTLLMCKHLPSHCQYVMQFSDGKVSEESTWPDLSLNGIRTRVESFCDEDESLGKNINMFVKSNALDNCANDELNRAGSAANVLPDSNFEEDVHRANDNSHVNKTKLEFAKNTSIKNVDDSSYKVELETTLYKIDHDKILYSIQNDNWQVLTPEIADKELPNLGISDVPKDHQSIVFQMLYLDELFCPKMSDLIFGDIVKYDKKKEEFTLKIPFDFIKDLAQDNGPDELLMPIAPDTYVISRETLRNTKLLN